MNITVLGWIAIFIAGGLASWLLYELGLAVWDYIVRERYIEHQTARLDHELHNLLAGN